MCDLKRCNWVTAEPIYLQYHDKVWGRVVFDERELFEKLCLDGQQAGLSWLTILKKQQNYKAAFADFIPEKIVEFDDEIIESLMLNSGIVRNRLKINSIIKNAQAYLKLKEQGINFSKLLWDFVDCNQIQNNFMNQSEIPTQTAESLAMSKSLKKLGFTFVGPTICYAFMQAVGMVNDHLVSCHCYQDCNVPKNIYGNFK